MTKDEQDALVAQLGELAGKEAVKLVNRLGCGDPRRVFIVIAAEQIGPDLWTHAAGVGHPSDVVPDTRLMLKTVLDKLPRPS